MATTLVPPQLLGFPRRFIEGRRVGRVEEVVGRVMDDHGEGRGDGPDDVFRGAGRLPARRDARADE